MQWGEAMKSFEKRREEGAEKLHAAMSARLDFFRKRLWGIDIYANTTRQRLDIQRSSVSNAEREVQV